MASKGFSVDFDVDNALKVLKSYPINAHKVVDKAIRKAGSEAVKEVRSAAPYKKWSKLAKGKLKSYKEGSSIFKFGLYNKNQSNDGGISDWFKAYWYNYGTMEHRDPTHVFSNPRKAKTRNRKGGQKPKKFFEPSAERGMQRFQKRFISELDKATDEILKIQTDNGRTTTTTIQ